MAQRRMFNKAVVNSARFLKMPLSSQALYFHLGTAADDEGVVEAFAVLRMCGAAEDDLRVLAARGLIQLLDPDELVAYISDWNINNTIRKDRFTPSIYHDLLVQIVDLPDPDPLPTAPDEPEQTIIDLGPLQPEPEKPKAKREYKGPRWSSEKVNITDEARAIAAELAQKLDDRTPGAPPTSGQKKHAYARVIQELIDKNVALDNIKGALLWLCSDAYGAEYHRGRLLQDAATLTKDFKIITDKALAAFKRAQTQTQRGWAS